MSASDKLAHLRRLGIAPHPFVPTPRRGERSYCRECDGHRLFIGHEASLRREEASA